MVKATNQFIMAVGIILVWTAKTMKNPRMNCVKHTLDVLISSNDLLLTYYKLWVQPQTLGHNQRMIGNGFHIP